mmetsp:Transcript_89625/g.249232  ORF Transcript_89625/g.249232 Transcript_89625/m.249232 type:complete len:264 (+) Transcript_89625:502-1293(+)
MDYVRQLVAKEHGQLLARLHDALPRLHKAHVLARHDGVCPVRHAHLDPGARDPGARQGLGGSGDHHNIADVDVTIGGAVQAEEPPVHKDEARHEGADEGVRRVDVDDEVAVVPPAVELHLRLLQARQLAAILVGIALYQSGLACLHQAMHLLTGSSEDRRKYLPHHSDLRGVIGQEPDVAIFRNSADAPQHLHRLTPPAAIGVLRVGVHAGSIAEAVQGDRQRRGAKREKRTLDVRPSPMALHRQGCRIVASPKCRPRSRHVR